MGRSVLAGALTMSLLILPVVIVAAQEALRSVPPSIRHGSLALGATRWQTVWHQVLPSAVPGIMTGVILSLSRALGEAALGGAPVVAYDIDWHSDLIESGVTGELVAYRDHVGLAAGLQRFIDDSEYGRRVGTALRERALRVLDPDHVDTEQLSVYRELLDVVQFDGEAAA